MPIVDASSFTPSGPYRNGHYNTFIPYLFGKMPDIQYERVRIDTPDGDFLDLDFQRSGRKRLAIVCHGLEGSSRSSYVLLTMGKFIDDEWDVLCPNYRGCSGEMNRKLQMYNSGSTTDLDTVISHVESDYDEIALVGISLGANLVLKYMGEGKWNIPDSIKSVTAVSAPVDLADGSRQLLKPYNYIYQLNFLLTLRRKIRKKAIQFPGVLDTMKLLKTFHLYHFDEYFTAPMFDYESADHYYADAMSLQYLEHIDRPSLILNAKDDPFLGPLCYPFDVADQSPLIHLQAPEYGGHVGFAYSRNDRSYMLDSIMSFINKHH